MSRTQERSKVWSRLAPALILSLTAVSVAIGLSFYLGAFSAGEPVVEETVPITISSETLDFGLVPLNDAVVRQLVLRNDGLEPVRARLSVPGSAYTVNPGQVILHPGIGTRVTVAVRAAQPGSLDDELRIEVEQLEGGPLVVALEGQAHAGAAGAELDGSPVSGRPRATEVAALRTVNLADTATGSSEADSGTRTATGESVVARRAPSNTASAKSTTTNPKSSGGQASSTPNAPTTQSRRPRTSADRDAAPVEESEGARRRAANLGLINGGARPSATMADIPVAVPETISDHEAERASRIPSRVPRSEDGELPERLPEEDLEEDDPFDDNLSDPEEPFRTPTLSISGVSSVRMLGAATPFYPQEIPIIGTDMGGPLNLTSQILFPEVPLAFGQSMAFIQAGPAGGLFDAGSGAVTIQLPLQAVDSDGNAAPIPVELTTATSFGRNADGVVVSITGSPRMPGTGIVRLVGMVKIPVGYGNSAEQHLVVIELLASLEFGTSIGSPSRRGR